MSRGLKLAWFALLGYSSVFLPALPPSTGLATGSSTQVEGSLRREARLCPVSRCGRRQLERDSFLESRDRAESEIYFKAVRAHELVYV